MAVGLVAYRVPFPIFYRGMSGWKDRCSQIIRSCVAWPRLWHRSRGRSLSRNRADFLQKLDQFAHERYRKCDCANFNLDRPVTRETRCYEYKY